MDELKKRIRHVPDFPKPGILYYDITTLLQDPEGFRMAVDAMAAPHTGDVIDHIVAIESRGFIFGAAMAQRLGKGFSPVRKPGKLPARSRSRSYELEYGTDTLHIHEDAVEKGQRVLIVDDLLATGGTAAAAVALVRDLGAEVVGVQFLIELAFLKGREKLKGEKIDVVLTY